MSPFLLLVVALSSISLKAAVFPKKALGFYCLIADDTVNNYTSTSNWQPMLYDYQINGTNVVWLTFINPKTMPLVPPAMSNLAKCKGQAGCPPADVPVLLSIGGYSYSQSSSSWPWLQSQSAAIAMAKNVSTWDKLYGVDGIDLDIENPAGNSGTIGRNLVAFAKEVKQLNPSFLITQPVYGYPQCAAEGDVVEAGFSNGNSNNLIETVGIMVYSDEDSLQWVADWHGGSYGVPYANILPGIQGAASSSSITTMANDINKQRLGGFMVWFASVWDKTNNRKALSYGWEDATTNNKTTGAAWAEALQIMNK